MGHQLLLVDDEPNVINALKRVLVDKGFIIFSAMSAEDGLNILSRQKIQVIVSDENMPGMSGAEFLYKVRRLYPDTIRFMLTASLNIETAVKAINEGEIYRFFTKPWDSLQLIFAIQTAFERYDLAEENRRLLETVKRQALEIKSIEKQFPGISNVARDRDGRIVIDNLSDDEIRKIIADCDCQTTETCNN